ncbi:MAG: hypothetical protein KIH62_003095 [Candidatus Kerfeldbacteria bacterium]|nr:hypothetical protein [Candidatus Kerfeldbacteria bacterium]
MLIVMKRQVKKRKIDKKSTIISRAVTEEERGGSLLLVDDEDVTAKHIEVDVDTLEVDDDISEALEESVEAEESVKKSPSKQPLRNQPKVVLPVEPKKPEHPLDELFDEDDDMDFSTLDKRRSRRGVVVGVFVTMLFLGISAFMGYTIFKDQQNTDGSVTITATVPEKVASGDVVDLDIHYTNNKTVTLDAVDIEIIYPNGFVPSSTTPEADDEYMRSFTFVDVAAGASGTIHIVGQLVGSAEQAKDFSVIMTYRPSNFSKDFQSQTVATTTISSSQISISVDAPTQVAAGQDVDIQFTYVNQAAVALNNIRIEALYPKDFTVKKLDPEASTDDAMWTIDTLASQESRTITITGQFSGASGEAKDLSMNIGIEEIDGTVHPQTTQTVRVVVVNPEFVIDIVAPDVATSNDEINLKTTITNNASADMQDIDIAWEVVGPVSGEKHWSDSFKKIQSGQSKDSEHVLNLDGGKTTEESVRIIATLKTAHLNGTVIALNTTVEKIIKIRSDARFSYIARYFDEDLKKIGSGPIPPEVGETTTYAVDFSFSTDMNGLSSVSCAAVLPEDVTFVSGDAQAEYTASTRTIAFDYNSVAVDTAHSSRFYLSITPAEDDVDHLKVLSEKMVCTAKNAFTDEAVSEELPRITTELSSDEGAAGKGVVVE